MKKILLGLLLGWSAHWAWINTEVKVEVKPPRAIKNPFTIAKSIVKPKVTCGTTCLQKKLPPLEQSLAGKKKELRTKIEVKEPSAEQLVELGILKPLPN
jgi:hypothetical protein